MFAQLTTTVKKGVLEWNDQILNSLKLKINIFVTNLISKNIFCMWNKSVKFQTDDQKKSAAVLMVTIALKTKTRMKTKTKSKNIS